MNSRKNEACRKDGCHTASVEDALIFEDLLDLEEIQRIQDAFAEATGVASVITRPDGTPLTQPSSFCHLCINIIRKTQKGLENCMFSDAVLGRPRQGGPIVQRCLSGGLLDAGCSIFAGEQHVANWLIGQVLDRETDTDTMLSYADEIGVEKEPFADALEKVPRMSLEQFTKVAQVLYLVANQLSLLALQNAQKAQELRARKRAEDALLREKKLTAIVESELTKHRDHLEQIVAQRTDELRKRHTDLERKNVELEKTRAELADKAESLEQVNRYKSEFFANISHELRTPLNSILILSGLLFENKTRHLDEREVSYAKTIRDAGSDLLVAVTDILDMTTFEHGATLPPFEPVSLSGLVAWADAQFRPQAEGKGLRFATSLAPDLPETIISDLASLQKILMKLLGNAIKFTQAGSVEFHIQAGAAADHTGASVTMAVSDSGIGIPPEQLASMFEAFRQGDNSFTRRFGGLGLGLAIASKLTLYLGGTIFAASSPGGGSTFTVELPAHGHPATLPGGAQKDAVPPATVTPAGTSSPSPHPSTAAPAKGSLPAMPCEPAPQLAGKRIALVDPDVRNVFLLTGALEKLGMVVNPFTDPSELLHHLKTHPATDFVLVDSLCLHSAKGDLLTKLRALEGVPELPILAMTLGTSKRSDTNALPHGLAGSVPKPVDIQHLVKLLCSPLPPTANRA